MIRALVVLIVCLIGCSPTWVEDPSDPEGLDPIEVLTEPPVYNYKPLRGSGYEMGSKSVDTPYMEQQRTLIKQYLLNLDEILKDKPGLSYYDKRALINIEMLVAYSWFYNFNPDEVSMKEVHNILKSHSANDAMMIPSSSRNAIMGAIKECLKTRNNLAPVSDYILLYSNGLFQDIKKELEANVRAYSTMIIDMNIISVDDYRFVETKIKNEDYQQLVVKNELLLEIHKVALKMAVQSYLIIIDSEPRVERGELLLVPKLLTIHTDQKSFKIPPMSPNDFEVLVKEAENEHDAAKYDERKSEDEMYLEEQNTMISKYLKTLENIQVTDYSGTKNYYYSQALSVIKMLILQSWLFLLHPDLKYLDGVYPVTEFQTSASVVNDNVKNELVKITGKAKAMDALVLYFDKLQPEIRDKLRTQVRSMIFHINNNIHPHIGSMTKEKMEEMDKNVRELAILKIMMKFHEVNIKMCLQSYVDDFMDYQVSDVTLQPSPGTGLQAQTMKVLELRDKNSYKFLMYTPS